LRFLLFRALLLDNYSVGRFSLYNSYFSDEFIGCRSNTVNFLYILLASPWLLMSYNLFENSLYSFYMAVLIHILRNVLSTITVNSLACWFLPSKICLSNTALIPRCWSEITIILLGSTISLRNHYINQPQFTILFLSATTINASGSSYCSEPFRAVLIRALMLILNWIGSSSKPAWICFFKSRRLIVSSAENVHATWIS
jgi:hypothetical protein